MDMDPKHFANTKLFPWKLCHRSLPTRGAFFNWDMYTNPLFPLSAGDRGCRTFFFQM